MYYAMSNDVQTDRKGRLYRRSGIVVFGPGPYVKEATEEVASGIVV
jgi:hypothetical protein